MMRYIVLLRGINVSGKNSIKMKELAEVITTCGYSNIKTYIQSGNIILDADSDAAQIADTIHTAIDQHFGFQVPVLARTVDEIQVIIDQYPWGDPATIDDPTRTLVTLLKDTPDPDRIAELDGFVKAPEKLEVIDNNVYLHCPNGYGRTKLNNNFLEKKLNQQATTRNWKTVAKLIELAAD